VWIDQAGIDVSTKSIQEIERARKGEAGTQAQTGQIRAMPGSEVIYKGLKTFSPTVLM